MCFSFAVATANDIQTIMICRFSLGLLDQQRLLFLQLFFRFVSDQAKGTAISTFAGVLLVVPCLRRYSVVSRLKL